LTGDYPEEDQLTDNDRGKMVERNRAAGFFFPPAYIKD